MLESNEKKLDPTLLRGLDKFKVKEDNVCPLKAEDVEDPDNEFWILQCPKNVDLVTLLKDKKFSLTGKTRLKLKNKTTSSSKKHVKSKKYELVGVPKQFDDSDGNDNDSSSNINSQGENLIVLLPDAEEQLKLVLAPLNGHIVIRDYIDETPIPPLAAEPKTIHQLPSGVRERHPATWKLAEDYIDALKKKMNDAKSLAPSKKTKRRKRRRSLVDVEEDQAPELVKIQEEDEVVDPEDITVIENVTIEDEVQEEEDDEPPKKKKKKKSKKQVDI